MKKILVVDDNEEILEVIQTILEIEGHEVVTTDTGAGLHDRVKAEAPNLVLLDIMLGHYNGLTLCHELKNSPDTSFIPIIMISASHNLLNTDCKADGYIAKPFEIDDLIRKVGSLAN